jgi:cytochrome b subunit of formate dehydrogenase
MGKGRDDEDTLKWAGGCCFCILFITGVILFSVSFGTLTPVSASKLRNVSSHYYLPSINQSIDVSNHPLNRLSVVFDTTTI